MSRAQATGTKERAAVPMSSREKTLSIIEMLPGLAAPTLSRDLCSLPTRRVPHLNPARGCRQRRNAGRPVLPVL
jgi:hypothetical protein